MQPNPWPPNGGIRYTVEKSPNGRTGLSFTEIATKKQVRNSRGEIDPWLLIEFNFKTRNAPKVNQFLKEMFNCPLCPDGVNRMFRGGEVIYLPPSVAPGPPPKDILDLNDLAKMLDIEPSALNRLFNQYGWTIDSVLNVVGLIGEFAPIAVAAAEVIAVGGLILGTITSFVGFFAYLARLDQEDGIAMGTFAACYQFGDWAVEPHARLSESRVDSPAFPDVWVKHNFLHTPPGRPLPPHYQDRYRSLRSAWEAGANKMRENTRMSLDKAYTDYSAKVGAKGGKPAPKPEFEDLVKLLLLKELNLLKFSFHEARGYGVTNHMYAQLRPRVEQSSNMKLLRKDLPYPSQVLNRDLH